MVLLWPLGNQWSLSSDTIDHQFTQFLRFFQAGGNDGHLLNLSSRYADKLGIDYLSVLQQLEDIRLAEWSEVSPPAPPPTSASSSSTSSSKEAPSSSSSLMMSSSYVNYNPAPKMSKPRIGSGADQQIYVPGTYKVRLASVETCPGQGF